MKVETSGEVVSINPIDSLNQILLCTSKGLIMTLILKETSKPFAQDFQYSIHDLCIKCNTTLLLPSRYDNKSFDLWIGSDNSEIFCFSLKTMKLTGSYLHCSSHHFLTNSLLNTPTSPRSSTPFSFPLEPSETPKELNVTVLKTTLVDTFFLWSYVYPGSTIYLWNHVSKKIMSAYNCRKSFEDLNFSQTSKFIFIKTEIDNLAAKLKYLYK